MKNLTEKQELIFRQHNDAKGFFFTSDEQAFSKEGDCNNHKHTLEDKTTGWIDNPYYGSGKQVASTDEAPAKPAASAKAKSKVKSKANAETSTTPKSGDQKASTTTDTDPVKEERALLVAEYKVVLKKKPSPAYNNAKLKELIEAEKAKP